MYQLIDNQSKVIRISDKKIISPCDSDQDIDFVKYVAWCEEGNEPEILSETKEYPVIQLPMHIAIIMLTEAGYMDAVQDVVNTLAKDDYRVGVAFNKAPHVNSDNAIVNAVLGKNGLGLSNGQIHQLFVDALAIKL